MTSLHRSTAELGASLDDIRRAPRDVGRLVMIVRRPAVDQREVPVEARVTIDEGLVGDTWATRPSRSSPDGGPHPDKQLTLINSRFALLLGGSEERAALAGDQLHVDLDLSTANLPTGSRLHIGDAVIEITEAPHTGCRKFSDRFGAEALRFVNGEDGQALRLRGVNARVVVAGTIRRGDPVHVERTTDRPRLG